MANLSRRSWLKATTFAPFLGLFSIEDLKRQLSLSGRDEIALGENDCFATMKHMIEGPKKVFDVIVSFPMTPADIAWKFRLLRDDNPNPLLQMTLNQRATFRWVAMPGMEIVVPRNSKLIFKYERIGEWCKDEKHQKPDIVTTYTKSV